MQTNRKFYFFLVGMLFFSIILNSKEGDKIILRYTEVIIYGINKDSLTRFPITEERISDFYEWKLEIRNIEKIQGVLDLLLQSDTKNTNMNNVRLRIDFILDGKTIKSILFDNTYDQELNLIINSYF